MEWTSDDKSLITCKAIVQCSDGGKSCDRGHSRLTKTSAAPFELAITACAAERQKRIPAASRRFVNSSGEALLCLDDFLRRYQDATPLTERQYAIPKQLGITLTVARQPDDESRDLDADAVV